MYLWVVLVPGTTRHIGLLRRDRRRGDHSRGGSRSRASRSPGSNRLLWGTTRVGLTFDGAPEPCARPTPTGWCASRVFSGYSRVLSAGTISSLHPGLRLSIQPVHDAWLSMKDSCIWFASRNMQSGPISNAAGWTSTSSSPSRQPRRLWPAGRDPRVGLAALSAVRTTSHQGHRLAPDVSQFYRWARQQCHG